MMPVGFRTWHAETVFALRPKGGSSASKNTCAGSAVCKVARMCCTVSGQLKARTSGPVVPEVADCGLVPPGATSSARLMCVFIGFFIGSMTGREEKARQATVRGSTLARGCRDSAK